MWDAINRSKLFDSTNKSIWVWMVDKKTFCLKNPQIWISLGWRDQHQETHQVFCSEIHRLLDDLGPGSAGRWNALPVQDRFVPSVPSVIDSRRKWKNFSDELFSFQVSRFPRTSCPWLRLFWSVCSGFMLIFTTSILTRSCSFRRKLTSTPPSSILSSSYRSVHDHIGDRFSVVWARLFLSWWRLLMIFRSLISSIAESWRRCRTWSRNWAARTDRRISFLSVWDCC